ncbi:MAG: GNAT family N-acetyltransferase [Polyangiaceae bacterium]|nr:GNAT family N-acetyltransferase [Polyangiaceae bacterium]
MHGLDVTFTTALSSADAADYDRFVRSARGGSYAQDRAWAQVAVAGRPFAPRWFLARRSGVVVGAAGVLRPMLFGVLPLPAAIVERGPVTDSLADLREVLAALRSATIPAGIARLSVMPYWAGNAALEAERILEDAGFNCVQTASGAHARTLRIDLRDKSSDAIFAGKQGEALRRKLRQADRAGAVARQGTRADVVHLAALYNELMQSQGRAGKSSSYFDALGNMVEEGRGAIFLSLYDGAAVSALYASLHGKIATFVIGASSTASLPFSKMAPTMAAAIRWAHARGCEIFDMGGIPLESDTDDKRRSIAQFKLDFAKVAVPLAREYARWL